MKMTFGLAMKHLMFFQSGLHLGWGNLGFGFAFLAIGVICSVLDHFTRREP